MIYILDLEIFVFLPAIGEICGQLDLVRYWVDSDNCDILGCSCVASDNCYCDIDPKCLM